MPSTLSFDLVGGLISFALTLMVLSYLIGDNPAFRVAVYIFVGVAAGYAAAVTWWQVLVPHLFRPLNLLGQSPLYDRLLAAFSLIGCLLLLMKLRPSTARLGISRIPLAFLVGVGAAVAVGGAVIGTILPQVQASYNVLDLSNAGSLLWERLFFGVIMLIGTITTLVYFHFGAKSTPGGPERSKPVIALAWIGQFFIAITLGTLFAGVLTAAMTALIERLNFILTFIPSLIH